MVPAVYFAFCGIPVVLVGIFVYWVWLRISQLRGGPPGKFGHQYTIVLNDFLSFAAAFRDNDDFLQERFESPFVADVHGATQECADAKGLIFANGTHWKFASLHARRSLYQCIHHPDYTDILATRSGALVQKLRLDGAQSKDSLKKLVGETVLACVVPLLLGENYADCPENLRNIAKLLEVVGDKFATGCFHTRMVCRRHKLRRLSSTVKKSLNENIRGRMPLANSTTTFVSAYLDHLTQIRNFSGQIVEKLIFSEKELVANLIDLIVSSCFPLTTVLCEGVFLIARNATVQRKLHEELQAFEDDPGNHSHEASEPSRSYLTAVYCEILRLVDVTQLGACRRTVKPFSLLGFQIAQDALLIGNLHAIHRNKKDWKRPDEFYPERFLDERNMLRIPNNLVPFSLGQRACPGGYVATAIVTQILQHVLMHFQIVPSAQNPGLRISQDLAILHFLQRQEKNYVPPRNS